MFIPIKKIRYYCVFIVFLWLVTSCSTKQEATLVNKNTPITRDYALLVVGVSFVDEFNDPDQMLNKRLLSQELLNDNDRISSRRIEIEKSGLRDPLYYLSNFKFLLDSSTGEEEKGFVINRFNRDLQEYEHFTIHRILPGSYTWKEMEMDQYRFYDPGGQTSPIRWNRFHVSFPLAYSKWTFESGKIYYLGDMQFFFKTKKFRFGLFPRESVVDKIQLTHLLIQDNFEEMKASITATKPWFPVKEILNVTTPKELIQKDGKLIEGKWQTEEKKETPAHDKKKYFF